MKMFKRFAATALCTAMIVSGFSYVQHVNAGPPSHSNAKVENVIFMIPDGYSASYATNYRIYKGEDTVLDSMLVGMMKTNSADNWVTDSAAAGTAMATGSKTNNGMVSVSPEGEILDTVLEAASDAGKSTGLVATSTITHATPAVFGSHVESRGSEADIALQLINDVDVMLGGGKSNFLPKEENGNQAERNLVEEAKSNGYEFVETKEELLAMNGKQDKVLGLFADGGMAPELDRDHTEEPSLADMTTAALHSLSNNKKGFFLMVEGSQIDWAGHAHDAAWAMKDSEAFEMAVEEALEFAKKDGKTLVVVAGDHDTGGMSVGGYDEYLSKVDILRDVTATGDFMAGELNEDRSNARDIVSQYANIKLTEDEEARIKSAAANQTAMTINQIISERAYVGWTSKAHTGVDVPVYAYGPQSDLFYGLLDNTDLPNRIAEAMKIEFGK
ncbi:alkaline phosphatase [Alkalihalophilus marmarensis]|jgi:alkaline phosphatase|uniref:Alkaline phosphatase n=1 Tax=Alkalihalophilus marmarensis DSM 21297 TaxID=1188261 RepID=U6SUR3_9BACI|nr:alkaline phosphatase [Alkalihalophilus marmarensis]ERN54660.1 alkaline phosphatase [Alkalihalophilus marmarensis DSM 21297]MCM3488721.1 alkaline phosphatase [Alkalihalophilus marmarensis]